MYSIQHYVIKFISYLWQVGGFHQVPWFSSTNKTDRNDSLSQMSTVLTGKIVVGPTNYDLFPDQMSDVFRDRFHDLYFLSMRDYKE